MKLTKIVIGIVLFTSISACNLDPLGIFKTDDDDFKIKWHSVTPAYSLCKDEADVSLTPGTQVQNQSVDINRKNQRVITRGCNGEVKSDSVVTIDPPDQHVTIKPVTEFKVGAYEVTVRNRSSCAQKSEEFSLPANGETRVPEFRFHVNTSPTVFHFRIVKDVENFLDYEFFSCSEISKTRACNGKVSLEKGTVILKVNYVEETLATRETVDCPAPTAP